VTHVDLIAAILSGEDAGPPEAREWPALLDAAAEQGVVALLFDRARAMAWHQELVRGLRTRAVAATAVALAQNREVESVLESLSASGIEALVIKGGHLGLSHYPSPGLRPRTDTDLLIRDQDRTAVGACLAALEYQPLPHVTGDVAFTQRQFWRVDDCGFRHAVDIHWRVANPRVFADRLTWSELHRDRVRLTAGGHHAFAPSAPHALVLACIHRTAHHGNSDRLIWLFDMRLLAASLSSSDWETVVRVSGRSGMSSVVANGLHAARHLVKAPVPADVLRRLDEAAPLVLEPDLRRYLEGRQSPVRVLLSDWRRLRGWPERATFLREHLLPVPAYMASRYQVRSRAALPFLYVHRLVTGCGRWLRT
jgi:hypothetical protein